jgi:hypothetical protein
VSGQPKTDAEYGIGRGADCLLKQKMKEKERMSTWESKEQTLMGMEKR